MVESSYETIVVGGGMSGMVCALLQGRKGRRVAIVERSAHLSPTLWGFERSGTYFDTGFHYTGSAGADGLLGHLLDRLGLYDTLATALSTWDVFDHIRLQEPSCNVRLTRGWQAMEQGLSESFPDERDGVRGFLGSVRSAWEQGCTAFKQDFGRSLGPLSVGDGGSLHEAVLACTDDPVLQAVLSCHGLLYGTPARETSLRFHSLVVGSYYESACAVRGGGRAWIKCFADALGAAGVETRCGQEVVRLCLDERGRCSGVELDDGQCLAAANCVCTVHPKAVLTLLPKGGFSPAFRRRIMGLEESFSAVVLFARCRLNLRGNLILAGRAESLIGWQDLPIEERPLFVSCPADVDAGLGGVSVICPATLADVPGGGDQGRGHRPQGYESWKGGVADRLSDRLSACAGDLIEDLEILDVATPLTFRDWLNSPEGGIYATQHRRGDMPLLPQTRVPGLFLSGQAVVAPGVLGAMCAGFLTESCIPS